MTNNGTPCISGGYTNMMTEEDGDLIRRSDALDCFHCWVDKYGDVHTPDEMPEYRAIEELPSVEPEIIRCKDCKHRYVEDMIWHCPFSLMGGENFFCGYGSLGTVERKRDG